MRERAATRHNLKLGNYPNNFETMYEKFVPSKQLMQKKVE